MTNFRRSISILALRDKVPFLAKSVLISYVKMNTFNIVFVGKWMYFMPKNKIDCFGLKQD